MEAVQCMEGGSEATVKPETNRVLKRNLEELAKDGQINGTSNETISLYHK